jgi:outer membrane scaffolding protein for murein synthesis (MipA/OmpV family)
MIRRLALSIAPFVLAASAHAQDQAAPPVETSAAPTDQSGSQPDGLSGNSITVGVAGAYIPDYEGSSHNHFYPAPGALITYNGFNFTLAGNRASLDLIPDKGKWDFQAGPMGVLDFNRSTISQIDDLRVRELGKRASSIELGGFVGLGRSGVLTSPYDKVSVSVSYRKGVTGAQRGGILQPSFTYFAPVSHKAAIALIASAERAERGYAEAYYDIDPAQSFRSGLPVYYTRGGWKDYTVGLVGTRSITGNLLHGFKLVGGVTYMRLLNGFADSPIVSIAGSKSQWTGILGVAYTF